jgi:hypothetical protein
MALAYKKYALGALCLVTVACTPEEDTGAINAPVGAAPASVAPTPLADASVGPSAPAQPVMPSTPSVPSTPLAEQPAAPSVGPSGSALPCDVKATLDKNCIVCHDGKGTAGTPMGLTKYEDLLGAAPISRGKKVYQAVGARIHDSAKPMPPAGVLPAEQLKALDAWIAASAPAAAPNAAACTPAAPTVPTTAPWPPAEGCDAIYKITAHGEGGLDTPFMVAPGQEVHPQISVDAPWGNEPAQAIQFRVLTDNKKVLHHWILYAGSAFLTGWAPGDEERPPLPADVGMDLPTGPGSLRLDMHYNSLSASEMEADKSGVEICIVKGARMRKNHAAITMSFAVIGFPLVPANASNYNATANCKIVADQPIHLMSASPHSHTYAVGHKFTVKKANGSELVMLDKPFQFGKEVILENGDTVTTTCVYTNTTNSDISFGENTGDEMCFNFASYYPKDGFSCDLIGSLFDL